MIMSNYNHGHFLPTSIGSLLKQTRQPDEIIIVDDGSTDNSVEILERFAKENPVIRLIRNEKNIGTVPSGENALRQTSGDYVFLAAADDSWMPELFEKSMALIEKYPMAAFCCSDSRTVFAHSGKGVPSKRRLSAEAGYLSPEELIRIMRRKIVYLSGFGAIIKKSALNETGLLPELRWSSDRICSQTLALRYGICYIPEVLSVQLLRRESYGAAGLKNWKLHKDVIARALDLLRTQGYQDVLPKFKKSCCLASFNFPLLRVIAANKKYRDYLSFRLVWLVLAGEVREAVAARVPGFMKKIYWAAKERFGSGL